jgi:hypothetical protein
MPVIYTCGIIEESLNDTSICPTAQMLDGVPTGYWERFQKDGTRMRSGTFEMGIKSESGQLMTGKVKFTR